MDLFVVFALYVVAMFVILRLATAFLRGGRINDDR